jgi:CheY-like chemotaxis protein
LQTIRIALFSPRNKPLLSTIIGLTIQPKYNFTLDESADTTVATIDIAIVTASDAPARALLAKTLVAKPSIQVLLLARDESEFEPPASGTKHFMLHKHLMGDLVTSLNRLAAHVPLREYDVTAPLATIPDGPTPAARAAAARAAVNVAMPKSSAPHPAARSPLGDKVQQPAARRLRLRALMVDSNLTVHAQLREVIESIGMKCDTAKSAPEALNLLINSTFNIIYVDATNPEMDAYKLIHEIKRNPTHKAAAIILLTSSTSPFDAVRGTQAGCDTYITKPIELKNFYTATVAALSQNIDANEVSSLTRDPTVTLPVKQK